MPRLRCFSLLAVSLLPLLSLLLPLASSAKSAMQPHCDDNEMACFVNLKCVIAPNIPLKIDSLIPNEAKLCDVHLQIRPYSKTKALVRLKTKKGPIKLSYEVGGTATEIFGCEQSRDGIRRTGPTTAAKEYFNGERWETGIACEFIYNSESTELFDPSKAFLIEYGDKKVPGTPGQLGTSQIGPMKDGTKCDIDWLEYKFDEDEEKYELEKYKYSAPNKFFSDVVCPEGTLVFETEEGTVAEAADVKCDDKEVSSVTGWKYVINATGGPFVAKEGEPKNVGCRSSVCKKCVKDWNRVKECTGTECKNLDIVEVDGCYILKCKDNSTHPWIKFNNEKKPSSGHAVCAKNPDADDKKKPDARWFTHDHIPVDKAQCVSTVECQDHNALELDASKDTVGLDLAKNSLKCSNGLISYGDGQATTEIVCDIKSGKWKAKNDGGIASIEVPAATKLSCQVTESTTEAVAGAKIGPLEMVAMGIGALICFVLIAIVIFCFTCKKKLDKRRTNKKIKTITESRGANNTTKSEEGLKTALPVGYVPPPSSDHKPEPELVEKTTIAQTPESKPKSVMMNTAVLATTTATQQDLDHEPYHDIPTEQMYGKPKPILNPRDYEGKSGGSDRTVRLGDNGEILDRNGKPIRTSKEQPKSEDKSGEKSKTDEPSKTDPATTKKEEKKKEEPKPPVDTGPQPQVFALNEKEEKIRKGATKKQTEYPTLDDVLSDWSDYDEAYRNGDIEGYKKRKEEREKRKKRGKSQEGRNKTVPTAVTPDQPPSVERTQATRTRNTVDGKVADMENLLTQMDTTLEQKDVDSKKK